jgi:hypothetical protein
MFRLLIISLEIFALVAILRSPFVQYWFTDTQSSLSDWMTELSELADQQELGELRDVIAPHMQNMKGYQKDYLDDITSSKHKVGHFRRLYCEAGDKNPYIYGSSLRYFCSEIKRKISKSTLAV